MKFYYNHEIVAVDPTCQIDKCKQLAVHHFEHKYLCKHHSPFCKVDENTKKYLKKNKIIKIKNKIMDKKEFVKSLINIKSILDDIDGVHLALKKLDPDFGGLYMSRVETALIDMLEKLVDDKSQWISYYIYDLEWGKKWKLKSVTDKRGKDIPLKTMENLFDCIKHKDLYKT